MIGPEALPSYNFPLFGPDLRHLLRVPERKGANRNLW